MVTSPKNPFAQAKDLWSGQWNQSEGITLVKNGGRVFVTEPLARRDLFVQLRPR